jgi:hypothetical protein
MELRQERDFGEKINATFTFVVENWRPLVNALLLLVLPISMLSGVFAALQQNEIRNSITDLTQNLPKGSNNEIAALLDSYLKMWNGLTGSSFFVVSIIVGFLSQLLLVMTVNAYMLAYLDNKARPIDLNTILVYIKKHIVAVVVNRIAVFVVLIFATLAFFFPLLYLFLPLSVFPTMVIMAENNTAIGAIGRSISLISGKWWSTFGLMLVIGICYALLSSIFSIPAGIVSLTEIGRSQASLAFITVTAISTGLASLLQSLILIAANFQYFNLVERRDGLSLFKEVDDFGTNTKRVEREDEGEY